MFRMTNGTGIVHLCSQANANLSLFYLFINSHGASALPSWIRSKHSDWTDCSSVFVLNFLHYCFFCVYRILPLLHFSYRRYWCRSTVLTCVLQVGEFTPTPGFLTTAPKLLGIFWNASLTFPRYILATET